MGSEYLTEPMGGSLLKGVIFFNTIVWKINERKLLLLLLLINHLLKKGTIFVDTVPKPECFCII